MSEERRPIHRLPPRACPHCGHKLDAASPGDPAKQNRPSAGDITICIGCQQALVYAAGLKLRLAVPAELAALSAEERLDLARARRMVCAMRGSQ